MVVNTFNMGYVWMFICTVVPMLILGLSWWLVHKWKRGIKVLCVKNEKQVGLYPANVEGTKIKASINGHERRWNIVTEPFFFSTFFGDVPAYKVEFGNTQTGQLNKPTEKTLTEKDLAKIENQSILTALLKVDLFSLENIPFMVGFIGIGVLIGIIAGKFIFGGGS